MPSTPTDLPKVKAACPASALRPGAAALTAESVREFCTGQLAHYKIPRYVHVVDDFPMTVTGKVRKVEMRELAVDLLDLHEAAAVRKA